MDTGKTADERAQALLDASSQHQKYRWLVEQPATQPTVTTWSPGFSGEANVVYPAQVDCTPNITYVDGPEGVRASGVTDFPSQIALASAWDAELAYEKGAREGEEAYLKQKNVVLAPGIGSGRTPLAGRTPEYFGEDALINGLLAAEQAEGLESTGKVMANLKHFVANEQELDRQTSSSNMDERTLRQVYGLPYEIAAANSDAESLMCSFNQVNGVFACENDLIRDVLKGDYGFDGFVMSDFGSVHSTAATLNNGMDQELNRPIWFTPARLDAALEAGEITQARIEEAATKVIVGYLEAGLFDHALPATAAADASSPEGEAIAQEIAEDGSVLLKNEGILPLDVAEGDTIALIGPTASRSVTQVGGIATSAVSVCSLTLQFRPTFPPSNTLPCEDVVSAETALTARAAEVGATVVWNDGQDLAAAAALAASADAAIVVGYQRMGEFNDLTNLRLQGGGDALVSAVAAANPETVVVVQSGSAVEMPWIDDVDAVLEAWYGGEQQGPALASLLFGDVNPSGKLTMTFPKSLADTPTNTPEQYPGVFSDGSTTRPAGSSEIRQVNYTEGLEVGYKWYDEQGIEPLFEFGHGLSYTSFEYSDLAVSTAIADGTPVTTVGFDVTNSGERAGTEIPQVYLTLPEAADEPGKRLVGFDRISLEAGQTQRVEVVVDGAASNHPFEIWDADADEWTIVDGDYGVSVGASSRNLPLAAGFALDLGADTTRPTATLVAPTTAGPTPALEVQVDATDAGGLNRIVANVYQGTKLVKSTQTKVGGATAGSHTATVNLPDGSYTVRYNSQDLAGNISQTREFAFTIDGTKPTATVKAGAEFTVVGANGAYDKVSFKLYDAQKVDKVVLNGVVKDLTNNPWSDVNFIKPGVFGAVAGANTLVVHDVAGNTETVTFTLN
ncbi:glycoside hydrolase family 3 C-terminal domain-containing protein [Agromyces seonyuensis]|nr:glycoside hydrolase family 3 C-terminal domain-containing protein [Agromyces seonyuensis]